MEIPLGFLEGDESGWAAQMASVPAAQNNILAVRRVVDIPDPAELADEVVLSAMQRAAQDVLSRRTSSADTNNVRLAILQLAAYLAYQSYSDRVTHQLPGSFDQSGVWNPVASVVVRETQAKLRELKEIADRAVRAVTTVPDRYPGFAVLMPFR
ncbi:MAG: hypothetical protein N3G75_06305 [Methanothrix sp.]|nr:hypothetical protein [Methanothrix sp.]MCX8207427.1 hypothetical protein [Methanothrix sp.]